MVSFYRFIGRAPFFFARAQAHTRTILAIFSLISPAVLSAAQNPEFIYDGKNKLRGVALDHNAEPSTLQKMSLKENCVWIKKQATAAPLMGAEDAMLISHIQAQRGVIVLETIRKNGAHKPASTLILGKYKTYPNAIAGESTLPSRDYPLAVSFGSVLSGQGDLVLHKTDSISVKTGAQIFTYFMPEMTIPSEGVVRFYPGTDDTLYFDPALKHPAHDGRCTTTKLKKAK
jgi:hypothetical protein